jgi:hypothetical protein
VIPRSQIPGWQWAGSKASSVALLTLPYFFNQKACTKASISYFLFSCAIRPPLSLPATRCLIIPGDAYRVRICVQTADLRRHNRIGRYIATSRWNTKFAQGRSEVPFLRPTLYQASMLLTVSHVSGGRSRPFSTLSSALRCNLP